MNSNNAYSRDRSARLPVPHMRIPIAAAKRFAQQQGMRQVIITAWDGARTHVVTYGVTVKDCEQAAEGGNFIKKALGWPADLCNALPPRSRLEKRLAEVRTAFADYMWSEGCDCCRDNEAHKEHAARLAKLLEVPPFPDGSGHDFAQFRTREAKRV